jgi:hypothetical protein
VDGSVLVLLVSLVGLLDIGSGCQRSSFNIINIHIIILKN